MLGWIPRTGIIGVIAASGLVGKLVLLVLLGFSVFVWAVIIDKARTFRRIDEESRRFLRAFRQRAGLGEMRHLAGESHGTPLSRVLEAGLAEWRKLTADSPQLNPNPAEWMIAGTQAPRTGQRSHPVAPELVPNILSAMERAISSETETLEHRLGVLATSATVCPFLGLFGTVWGIMDSFMEIQSFGTANINVVAPGIAEALITTVGGLAVAIPAVMGYNYFVRRLRRVASRMEDFASELASEIRREMYR